MLQILFALAWKQHGAFSTSQAEDMGVARSTLSRNCRAGVIVRKAPAVYVIAGTPDTARQRMMVELLAAGPGAKVTEMSGLGLWCPEIELPWKPVIVVPRSCGYKSRNAVIRRSSDLHLANPGVVDGIPVVGVARALLDASAGRTPEAVVGLIDACRRHLTISIGALLEVLRLHSRQGRPGIAVYRQALVLLGATVTKSEFERLVLRDLRAAGAAEPEVNYILCLPGKDPMELDIAWPEVLLDLELDGVDHVARIAKASNDRRRDRVLAAHDWEVPRFMWVDYVTNRDAMIDEILDIYERRAREFGLRS